MHEIIIFKKINQQTQIEVSFEGDTFWLSLNQIAVLFKRNKSVISRHFKKLFAEHELDEKTTVVKNATVQLGAINSRIMNFILAAIFSVLKFQLLCNFLTLGNENHE